VILSFHESNLRLRAMAGNVHIITVDNCFPFNLPCSSWSGLIGPDGNWIYKAPIMGLHVFSSEIVLPES
ncbi:MAG: hypothetical protein ACTSRA_18200, partial [Promethearchaeota archaeon]